jgi:hypothetical protein
MTADFKGDAARTDAERARLDNRDDARLSSLDRDDPNARVRGPGLDLKFDALVTGKSARGATTTSVSVQISDPRGPGLTILNLHLPNDEADALPNGATLELLLRTRAGQRLISEDRTGHLHRDGLLGHQDTSAVGTLERNTQAVDDHKAAEKAEDDRVKAERDLVEKESAAADERRTREAKKSLA